MSAAELAVTLAVPAVQAVTTKVAGKEDADKVQDKQAMYDITKREMAFIEKLKRLQVEMTDLLKAKVQPEPT